MSESVQTRDSAAVPYQLYLYDPSLGLAAAAVAVFVALTLAHCYQMIKSRLWICIPFVLGGNFETIGYIGRALGHGSPTSKPAYIMQSVLILVAPALFAASIYMTLGRLMRAAHSEKHSPIRTRWLTKLFVVGDILSFFIQGGGGGIMASGKISSIKMGEKVILGGLFFQLIIFGCFILVAVVLHVRMRRYPTAESSDAELKWEKMLFVLYTVSALIMLRNIVRVVEYLGGRTGPLLRVEWPIYAFDALFMAATMAVFSFGYPSMLQRGAYVAEDNVELPSLATNGNSKVQKGGLGSKL